MATNKPQPTATTEAIRRAYVEKSEVDPWGRFVSRKNGRGIPVWTDADYEFCEMAEWCPRIVSYQAQPDILILDDGGHLVPFVIDFLVDLDTRLVLVGLPLGSKFPEGVEDRYVGLARTQCTNKGKDFVYLPGPTLMPEMFPVHDGPDAPPPLVLHRRPRRLLRPAPRAAVERAFQAEADLLIARFLSSPGGTHDGGSVGGPA